MGMCPSLVQTIPWTIALGALLASAVTDLKMRIIPNELVVLVALCGIAASIEGRLGGAWISLLAVVIVFLALGAACHYGLIGGGDAKLISAVTLLVPPDRIGVLLIEIALAGGFLSCVYLAARQLISMPLTRRSSPGAKQSTGLQHWIDCESVRINAKSVPYAIAILGGVIIHIASEYRQCFSATSFSF